MTVIVHNLTRGIVRIVDLVVPRWTSVSFKNLTPEQSERLRKAEAYGEVRCEPSQLNPEEGRIPMKALINPSGVPSSPKKRKR
jgi:hypothetical protein